MEPARCLTDLIGTVFDVVKDPFTRNFPQFLAFVCDGLNLGSHDGNQFLYFQKFRFTFASSILISLILFLLRAISAAIFRLEWILEGRNVFQRH